MAGEMSDAGNKPVRVTIDGDPFDVPAGTMVVAAVVLRHGIRGTRLSVSGQPRAALCAMGICHECRMTIDGRAHVLACQTLCREGMAILTEGGPS